METIDADVVVMVQGDEPMIRPETIDASQDPFFARDDRIVCVNLTARITTESEFENPNTIKVVMDKENFAVYMSRAPIPSRQRLAFGRLPAYKQVCIIPFTKQGLRLFNRLPATPLEEAESIDMLRFIEHGYRVKMVETDFVTYAVDTEEDRRHVEMLLRDDPLTQRYIRKAVAYGLGHGLTVNAGHGLTYHNVQPIAAISGVHELNIGPPSRRRRFTGWQPAVAEMKRLLVEAAARRV